VLGYDARTGRGSLAIDMNGSGKPDLLLTTAGKNPSHRYRDGRTDANPRARPLTHPGANPCAAPDSDPTAYAGTRSR
jgi:serralysin